MICTIAAETVGVNQTEMSDYFRNLEILKTDEIIFLPFKNLPYIYVQLRSGKNPLLSNKIKSFG